MARTSFLRLLITAFWGAAESNRKQKISILLFGKIAVSVRRRLHYDVLPPNAPHIARLSGLSGVYPPCLRERRGGKEKRRLCGSLRSRTAEEMICSHLEESRCACPPSITRYGLPPDAPMFARLSEPPAVFPAVRKGFAMYATPFTTRLAEGVGLEPTHRFRLLAP